jgi:hypothetical protein
MQAKKSVAFSPKVMILLNNITIETIGAGRRNKEHTHERTADSV